MGRGHERGLAVLRVTADDDPRRVDLRDVAQGVERAAERPGAARQDSHESTPSIAAATAAMSSSSSQAETSAAAQPRAPPGPSARGRVWVSSTGTGPSAPAGEQEPHVEHRPGAGGPVAAAAGARPRD